MAVLDKFSVAAPVLPKETVDVPELGGEVVVRGLMLSDRIRIMTDSANGTATLTKMLAATVIDVNNFPLFTEQQWEEFGATNFNACLNLFAVSKRLSGLSADIAEKN